MKKKPHSHDKNRTKANTTRKGKAENLEKVLLLRAEGHSYTEVGRMLGIHPTTVKNYCIEAVGEIVDPKVELKSRIRQISNAVDKALLKFTGEEITAAGLVQLMTYADRIMGVDRYLNSIQQTEVESTPLLTIHLSGGDEIILDQPDDYITELESASLN